MRARVALQIPVLAFALAGCESNPAVVAHWSKPGATYDEFLAVRNSCLGEARAAGGYYLAGTPHPASSEGVSASAFAPCMSAHGFGNDPKGFAPPAGGEVKMGP